MPLVFGADPQTPIYPNRGPSTQGHRIGIFTSNFPTRAINTATFILNIQPSRLSDPTLGPLVHRKFVGVVTLGFGG